MRGRNDVPPKTFFPAAFNFKMSQLWLLYLHIKVIGSVFFFSVKCLQSQQALQIQDSHRPAIHL